MDVNAVVLIGIVSSALSLFFSYFPGVSAKWELLPSDKKKLFMLGMVVATGGIFFALDCFSVIETTLTCDVQSAGTLVYGILIGISTNQATYLLTKKESSG